MDKKKKIISLLLLTLFVSYYASTTLFFHSHQYAWGTIIHSHPYTAATHAHSANALQLINTLTNLLFITIIAELRNFGLMDWTVSARRY